MQSDIVHKADYGMQFSKPFYDFRGVHNPADVIRKLEERADIGPVVFLVADRIGIFYQ